MPADSQCSTDLFHFRFCPDGFAPLTTELNNPDFKFFLDLLQAPFLLLLLMFHTLSISNGHLPRHSLILSSLSNCFNFDTSSFNSILTTLFNKCNLPSFANQMLIVEPPDIPYNFLASDLVNFPLSNSDITFCLKDKLYCFVIFCFESLKIVSFLS